MPRGWVEMTGALSDGSVFIASLWRRGAACGEVTYSEYIGVVGAELRKVYINYSLHFCGGCTQSEEMTSDVW
jgi:hypothetical protein